MGKDLIVVVPPGTRVRYIENVHIEGIKAYIIDAAFLEEAVRITTPGVEQLMGTPVYDAEKYHTE